MSESVKQLIAASVLIVPTAGLGWTLAVKATDKSPVKPSAVQPVEKPKPQPTPALRLLMSVPGEPLPVLWVTNDCEADARDPSIKKLTVSWWNGLKAKYPELCK